MNPLVYVCVAMCLDCSRQQGVARVTLKQRHFSTMFISALNGTPINTIFQANSNSFIALLQDIIVPGQSSFTSQCTRRRENRRLYSIT